MPERIIFASTENSVQLVLLFGRPGVGKLTVGELLAAETEFPLLHNHAVVDLAQSLFPFGTAGFVALRERLWHESVDAAIAARLPGVILTFAPESSVTDGFIPSLEHRVKAGGGRLRLIELRCSEAALEARLVAKSRLRFGKLRDPALYRQLEGAGVFDRPVMAPAELVLDVSELEPLESARLIAKHLRTTTLL